MEYLKWMSRTGVLPRRGRLLDIGESCLGGAEPQDIKEILEHHGSRLSGPQLDKLTQEYAYRSHLIAAPIPTLFLGELLEHTDVEYVSFDIVSARAARRFDLNRHNLHPSKKATFDLVTNFGTTEHLINQFNAYKVMHEALRPGGYMFSQVPATGYINHGYFSYNALMFRELAEANGYEVADLWFYGPSGDGNVLVNADVYPGVLDPNKPQNNVDGFRNSPVPNSLINVLFRKVKDGPFRVGLEVKTAAGPLDASAHFDGEYIEPEAPAIATRRRPFIRRVIGRLRRMLRARSWGLRR
jgi:hypothetical protein